VLATNCNGSDLQETEKKAQRHGKETEEKNHNEGESWALKRRLRTFIEEGWWEGGKEWKTDVMGNLPGGR